MKVKEMIDKLSKFDPDMECMINLDDYVKDAEDVFIGYYIDNGMDAPEIIDGSLVKDRQDFEAYGIEKDSEKIICIA